MGRNAGGVIGNTASTSSSGNLSELASNALEYYVSGNGYDLSYTLRHGEKPQGEDALLMKGLDEATQRPLAESMMVYRGVPIESLYGNAGAENYGLLKSHLLNNNKEGYVVDAYNKVLTQRQKSYVDKGYMSTTKSGDLAQGYGSSKNIVMKLNVPKGTKGFDMTKSNAYKTNTYEKEVLLARGTKFKIGKPYAKNGVIYIDATII